MTPDFEYVYVNQDGTVRELSPDERAYLSEDFDGGDGGRPYIKLSYKELNGWKSLHGFLPRKLVPSKITIRSVNPQYDALKPKETVDFDEDSRKVGDIVTQNADGFTLYKPNPDISTEERFQRLRQLQLERQRRAEELASNPDQGSPE